MARWLVTDGNQQFSARDFDELKQLVKQGRIGPGSMIQPPGATDWVYASEVPQLKSAFNQGAAALSADDPYAPTPTKKSSVPLLIGLALVIIVGLCFFWRYASTLPDVKDLSLLGGSHGLELSEMLVTQASAPLRNGPSDSASEIRELEKDSRIQLLAKRKGFYEVKATGGLQGWIKVDHVIPAYYFASDKEKEALDPIYNPDKYITVENSKWTQLAPDKSRGKAAADQTITVFEFLLKNQSRFEMTDLKLMATIKSQRGVVLEEKEIAVQGSIPAWESVQVGTMKPADDDKTGSPIAITYLAFNEMARGNEDLWLRWADGIEVPMSSPEYSEADITLLQVQAVLPKAKK